MKAMRIISCALTAAAIAAATASCGSVVRDSRAPVLLVVDLVQGLRGAVAVSTASPVLSSDVLTLVTSGGTCSPAAPCPTVFSDGGQITVHTVLKDIGLPGTTPSPSTNNQVVINRVRVSYRRSDGRNQEGVDVPYAFDTATTASVLTSNTVIGFQLVRVQAKQEPPLMALRTNGQIISMIADVTVFGADVVGNAVSATGSINIDFGNFGDQ
jgi:hypothetical protein